MTTSKTALAAGLWGAFMTTTLMAASLRVQSMESERAAAPMEARVVAPAPDNPQRD